MKQLQNNGPECSKISRRTRVHHDEWSGRSAICNGWRNLSQCLQKLCVSWGFTITNFLMNFHKCHALFAAGLSQTSQSEVLPILIPEMLTGAHRTRRMASHDPSVDCQHFRNSCTNYGIICCKHLLRRVLLSAVRGQVLHSANGVDTVYSCFNKGAATQTPT
jgi:hypothetical protein